MIYKSKSRYKTLERKFEGKMYVAIQKPGVKIKVNDYIFYVDEKTFKITEETTGLGIQPPKEYDSIEKVEKYIEEIYPQIRMRVMKWLQDFPHLHMSNFKEEGYI